MAEYRGCYKCRLCGETYYDCGTGNYNLALNTLIEMKLDMTIVKEPQKPHKLGIHNCIDGSMGLADFIGYKKVGD